MSESNHLDDLPPHWRAKLDVARVKGCLVKGPCWTWTGAKNGSYGKVTDGYHTKQIHRAVYERLVGPIPTELQVDHLCSNTYCCNPAHLEPVTRAVNMRRGMLRRRGWTHAEIMLDERLRRQEEEHVQNMLSRPSPTGLSRRSRYRRLIHKRAQLELEQSREASATIDFELKEDDDDVA